MCSGVDSSGITASDSQTSAAPTHIVGVGASAGGLEALEQFFGTMPPDSGMAFVVIQHLSPDFKSLMDELLSRHTRMRIVRTTEGTPVERNTIYLIPPRKNMVIRAGRLLLLEQEVRHGLNLPIDAFFESLAVEAGERGIAIVLSGTGSDGARGIRAVKESGGMVIVQREDTARFDGMPRSAIATGLADLVLPPQDIPNHLLRFIRHPLAKPDVKEPLLLREHTKLDEILRIVRRTYGADFQHYKPGTLGRRIERRMGINHIESPDEYIRLLDESPDECRALVKDVLIGVTQFFRDREVWQALQQTVLPTLIRESARAEPIRIWVPACSTGEEAYSIAMLMLDGLDRLGVTRELKIFATDVDRSAIETAGMGRYTDSIAADVEPDWLTRYFERRDDAYMIRRFVRENVIFAVHNVLKDPPFTKIDMVSCRNLLIYLQPEMQRRVIATFHFALKPRGVLLLGASEAPGDSGGAFTPLAERQRIFMKNPNASPLAMHTALQTDMSGRLRAPLMSIEPRARSVREVSPVEAATAHLAHHHAPPGLLLNERSELLHSFGDVSPYIALPVGEFSADVTRMLRGELRAALATALHKVQKTGEAAVYADVRLSSGDGTRAVDLRVERITHERQGALYLVLFTGRASERPALAAEAMSLDLLKDQRISDLEHELQQTRENLQATIEELETSNEELQSTNEELLASNEELQSTNEELHSVNEELFTVNAEFQGKINELTALTHDFDNLLHSTAIGVVFVDRDLRIRKFTPAARDSFNIMPTDIGRPIEHLTHNLGDQPLGERVRSVMASCEPFSIEITTPAGRAFLMTIRPFVVGSGAVDGAVITVVDVDELRRTQKAQREADALLRCTIDAMPANIALLDSNGCIRFVNAAWERFARENRLTGDVGQVGSNYLDAQRGEASESARSAFDGVRDVLSGRRERFELVYPCHAPTQQRWFRMRVSRIEQLGQRWVAVVHEDITAFRQANEARFRLAAIADCSPDPIIGISTNGVILSWNTAAERLYGHTAAEAIGRPVSTICDAHDIAAQAQALDRAAAGESVQEFTTTRRTRDGRMIHVAVRLAPIVDEDRAVIGVVEVDRDITARKQAEDALRRTAAAQQAANLRLQRSNQELEEFASIAAHDLLEPLRTVKGYCEIIRDRYATQLDDAGRDYFSRVVAAVDRLHALISDLRRFSQVVAAQMPIESVESSAVVRAVLTDLHQKVSESGAAIHLGDLPVVQSNASLLRQLFQNLIDNAIKYRSAAAPQIVISAARADHEWVFGVKDNGIGIRPEYHERAFQMFRRLNPRDPQPGTGVGLAIVKKIVDKLGGRVWIESDGTDGSTFHFTVPVESGAQEPGP